MSLKAHNSVIIEKTNMYIWLCHVTIMISHGSDVLYAANCRKHICRFSCTAVSYLDKKRNLRRIVFGNWIVLFWAVLLLFFSILSVWNVPSVKDTSDLCLHRTLGTPSSPKSTEFSCFTFSSATGNHTGVIWFTVSNTGNTRFFEWAYLHST